MELAALEGLKKFLLTYNGENKVFTISWLFYIRSFSYLHKNIHSSLYEFGFRSDPTTDYGVSCP